jgi:hypothetical protein
MLKLQYKGIGSFFYSVTGSREDYYASKLFFTVPIDEVSKSKLYFTVTLAENSVTM